MKQFKNHCHRTLGFLFICGISIGVLPGNAGASLIAWDFVQGSGDQLITRDTQSKLDWLDVNLTVNQNFDQVRQGIWYERGFRHATRQELAELFLHAGTPEDNFNVSNTHPLETLALANLLGPTLTGLPRISAYGFTGTDFFGNTIDLANHPIGSNFSALLGKVDYLDASIGEAHFSGGHPFSNQASDIYGSFLVRQVPEPGTLSMLAIGLMSWASLARRKGRR